MTTLSGFLAIASKQVCSSARDLTLVLGFYENGTGSLATSLVTCRRNILRDIATNGQTKLCPSVSVMAFIQSGQSWQFSTESDLEEVVWRNLPKLLNLRPLSRQFSISGRFCDILAVDEADQLVIIELKNTENRYVVQQLVRYYDAIQVAKALLFNVAMSEPRLVAMAMPAESDRTELSRRYAHRLPILHVEDRADEL